jgi:hypothetical protein
MAVAAKRKTTEKQFHNEVKFFIKLNLIFLERSNILRRPQNLKKYATIF